MRTIKFSEYYSFGSSEVYMGYSYSSFFLCENCIIFHEGIGDGGIRQKFSTTFSSKLLIHPTTRRGVH